MNREGGNSTYPARLLIITVPSSIDANKGHTNQRAVLERRTGAGRTLYARGEDVIA